MGIAAALLTLAWLAALYSLVTTGAVFGWIPLHLPLWVTLIGLVLVYQVVIWPLRAARHGIVPRAYGYVYPRHVFWDALVALFLFALIVWYFAHHGQDLQSTFASLQQNLQPAWRQRLTAWQTLIHGAH
ncbi:MAG: hypothetical protein ACRETZ_05095 [Steroidobacteraceae bacterium]